MSLWLCLVSLVSVLIPDGCWYSSDATTHHLNFFKMFTSSLHAMYIDYIICNRYIYIDTLKNNKKMKVRQTLVGLSPMGRIIDIHRMLVNYPERYWQSKNRELHMFNSIFKHKLVTGWQCYIVTSLGLIGSHETSSHFICLISLKICTVKYPKYIHIWITNEKGFYY